MVCTMAMVILAIAVAAAHDLDHQISILFDLIPSESDRQRVLGFSDSNTLKAFVPSSRRQTYLSDHGVVFDEDEKGITFISQIRWMKQQISTFNWAALSHLESLRILNLEQNALSGSIDWLLLPPELRELRLSHNQLTGTIDLGALPPNIVIVELQFNAFTGSVDLNGLETRETLKILDLSFNWLSGSIVITHLESMSGLERLDLRVNRGIPRPNNLPPNVYLTETFTDESHCDANDEACT